MMNCLSPVIHLAQSVASILPVNRIELDGPAWVVASAYLLMIALGFATDIALVIYFVTRPSRWTEQVSRLKARPLSTEQGALLLLVLMALYITSIALQPMIDPGFEAGCDGCESQRLVLHSICFHLVGLGVVALSLLHRRVTWRDAFGVQPRAILRDAVLGAVFYLAVLPFVVFYALVYQAVLRGMGHEIMLQEVAQVVVGESSFWMRVYLAALAVVFAPLFEEILFRGIGLPLLARKWGAAPAIVIVSLLFAAIHLHLPSMVPLFIIAAAFSLAYIHTGSIVVPVVMHGLFNGVNVAMLMLLKGA